MKKSKTNCKKKDSHKALQELSHVSNFDQSENSMMQSVRVC